MTYTKKFSIILVLSVAFVSLGYLLDSDPPYENIWDTVFEFGWLTGAIFIIFTGLYFLMKLTMFLIDKIKV